MKDLSEKSPLSQLVLAVLLALGMILMLVHPLAGKIVGLISGGILILLYLVLGILLVTNRDRSFETTLYILNYFGSAASMSVMIGIVIWSQNKELFLLIALAMLLSCLVLNLSHRYLYKIKEGNYFVKQVRLLFLVLICVLLMISGIQP